MVPMRCQSRERRPRERLIRYGVESLSLQDILCLILGSGASGRAIDQIAEEVAPILSRPHLSFSDLAGVKGIGMARAASLLAALELRGKLTQAATGQVGLTSPEVLYQACDFILKETKEHLVVFYLSSRSTILQREVLTIGTATASLIHPREVFRSAIQHNAAAIALAHNHPSGNTTPSPADVAITKQIAHSGQTLGIELVDHLICSPFGFTSLKMVSPNLFCYPRTI